MSSVLSTDTSSDTYAAAVVGAAAFAVCDSLHELGHLAAALLPLQVSVLSISSVGVSTSASSPWVALAGPLVNLLFAGTLAFGWSTKLSPNWRFFAWLLGSLNLFNCNAYLVYSALLGSGDWATVFDAFSPARLWRPAAVLAGAALYAGSVFVSLGSLRRLIAAAVLSQARAKRYCLSAYWAGGLLLTVASVLNPINPWLILTSGVATGFGAMAGLALTGNLLKGVGEKPGSQDVVTVHFNRTWVLSCAVVSVAFVVVLGRGLQFTDNDSQHAEARASDRCIEKT